MRVEDRLFRPVDRAFEVAGEQMRQGAIAEIGPSERVARTQLQGLGELFDRRAALSFVVQGIAHGAIDAGHVRIQLHRDFDLGQALGVFPLGKINPGHERMKNSVLVIDFHGPLGRPQRTVEKLRCRRGIEIEGRHYVHVGPVGASGFFETSGCG
jgi:hypothetical protein